MNKSKRILISTDKFQELTDFDVQRYENFENVTISGWANAIMLRYLFFRCAGYCPNEIKLFVLQILKNPLGKALKNNLPELIPENYRIVKDIDILTMWEAKKIIDEKLPEHSSHLKKWLEAWEANESLDPSLFDSYHSTLLKNKIYSSGWYEVELRVDLLASDKDILKSFKTWLSEKRAETYKLSKKLPNKRKREHIDPTKWKIDLKKWKNYRLMPCIDILLVEAIFNVKLRDKDFYQILFPNNVVDTDRLRDTIKPAAWNLLYSGDLLQMAANTSIESEKNKPKKSQ